MFDLDGTIVDTETVEYQSIREVWGEHGADYTVAHFEHVVGTSVGPDWVQELSAHLGRAIDTQRVRASRQTVKVRLLSALGARPGIEALIEEAAIAGIPMAVASNSPLDWVEARLHQLQLHHHLSALITIDIAVRPKPHPAPYLQACAALGAEPSRSIAFEDSATGVASARAAGMYTIACPGPLTLGHDLSAAHRIIGSHAELTLADLAHAVRA
ncbi:unannotated protein [freshwater metagenome]|uniref:Unannotated protein n=1 Tax=freshwater metagenome TaxID=449393 RepID=A0A6J7CRV2_9ZZZZ